MIVVIVTNQHHIYSRKLRNRTGWRPESLGTNKLKWRGSFRKHWVYNKIVRPHLNDSCRMANPRVPNVPLCPFCKYGLQKLELFLQLLFIPLVWLSLLFRMLFLIFFHFRIESSHYRQNPFCYHRILYLIKS